MLSLLLRRDSMSTLSFHLHVSCLCLVLLSLAIFQYFWYFSHFLGNLAFYKTNWRIHEPSSNPNQDQMEFACNQNKSNELFCMLAASLILPLCSFTYPIHLSALQSQRTSTHSMIHHFVAFLRHFAFTFYFKSRAPFHCNCRGLDAILFSL